MKNKEIFGYMILSISISLAILSIFLVSPFIERYVIADKSLKKSDLTLENKKVWGTTPGDLKRSIVHLFRFFNYEEKQNGEKKLELTNSVISYSEERNYTELDYMDSGRTVMAKNKKIIKKLNESKDELLLPSLGQFESLETLFNPSRHQRTMKAIYYLTDFLFGGDGLFNRKIFTVQLSQNTLGDKQKCKEFIGSAIEESKFEEVYSNKKYGLGKPSTFYNWAQLVGNDIKISEAEWLKIELDLSEGEIENLLGGDGLFSEELKKFNSKNKELFDCIESDCSDELIYRQLTEKSVLSQTLKDITSLSDLNKQIYENFMTENISPELENYYNSRQKDFKPKYQDIKPYRLDMEKLFSIKKNSMYSLLNPKNTYQFYYLYKVNDLKQAESLFGIKSKEQFKLIADYAFDYLPKTYLYREFEENKKKYTIKEIARYFAKNVAKLASKTYGKIKETGMLYKMAVGRYANEIMEELKDRDILCEVIVQKVIQDGHKTAKICSDNRLNMLNYDGLKAWVEKYKCVADPTQTCLNEAYNIIKKDLNIAINLEDVAQIISEDNDLGKNIKEAHAKIKEHYKAETLSDKFLIDLQNNNSGLTNNPPEILLKFKGESVYNWDSTEFPDKPEITIIQKEKNCSQDDCNPQSNSYYIDLAGKENYEKDYQNLVLKFEELFTLYLEKNYNSQISRDMGIKNTDKIYLEILMDQIDKYFPETKTLFTQYKPVSVIEGNNDEDKVFIDKISSGQWYDNYRPKLQKTTGFMQEILDGAKDEIFDYYKLHKKNSFSKNHNKYRQIFVINSKKTINKIQKMYSPFSNEYNYVDADLYNVQELGDKSHQVWMSDGIQYKVQRDEAKEVHYYDEISGRVFEFKYDSSQKYDGLTCQKFVLNDKKLGLNILEEGEDTNENKRRVLSEKIFNKPIAIYPPNYSKDTDVYKTSFMNFDRKQNFICVDPSSTLVLESNLTLIYALDSKNYGKINSAVGDNVIYPLFVYNRYSSISKKEFEAIFTDVKNIKKSDKVFMGIGIPLGIISLAATVVLIVMYFKSKKEEKIDSIDEGKLVPDSFIDGEKN